MKKYILIIMCMLSIGMLSACTKEIIFEFPKEEIQSLSVYTYDIENSKTTNNWVYAEEDMSDFLYYLEHLTGTKTDKIDTKDLNGLLYGVEMNAENPYTLLFIGDYAITYEGQYYLIDGEKAVKMCQSIDRDTRVYDNPYIVNHRYLSLLNGLWDTKYMAESNWTEGPLKNAGMSGTKTSIDSNYEILEFTITNSTGSIMEFGSQLELETLVDDTWYNIDDMINDNVNLGWTAELLMLNSGDSSEDKFYFTYYQPLPAGRYRLIKEVKVEDKVAYLSYEFAVN